MARINIEDSLECEEEFWTLLRLLDGDRDCALGKLVRFFRIAQAKWIKGESVLSRELESSGLAVMIESGWAVPTHDGFQAKGADSQFSWLKQRVEAGKSRASAERDEGGRFAKHSSGRPADNQRTTSGGPAADQREPATHQPPTPAPAPALRNIQNIKTKGALIAAPPDPDNKTSVFIAAYIQAFQARYGPKVRPDLRGKVQGQIKTFLRDYGVAKATELIQVFCQMDGERGWFKLKHHDFTTFVENLNVVSVALERGAEPGPEKINWKEFHAANSGVP